MGRKRALPPDFDGTYTEEMLSDRQRKILEFLRTYMLMRGAPPSVREIGEAVGLSSSSSVHNHLRNLQEMGFISRDIVGSRNIELLGAGSEAWKMKEMVAVPLVGRITAGQPILAVENVEDTYPIPKDLVGCSDDVFMLTVEGDSMIKAGIFDGDYIIARKQNYATNGDIVVALIDGESTTVKRYFRDRRNVRLQPENDKYRPILGTDNIRILGKVIAVFRIM